MAEFAGRDLGTRRTAAIVAGITLIALAARLIWLDNRVAHWDEARVAWWNLRYLRTGIHDYRPIIHGPFLGIVNRHVFASLGATDVAMRLPVALIGGLLPATAWLLRERLGDIATVALAGFLAANPLLLYYSRFMRSDVLVAAFMFAAFACIVRLYDDRQPRYLWAALACIGLGLTTKENAILYIAAWLGAAGLLLDHRLLFRDPIALARWAVGTLHAVSLSVLLSVPRGVVLVLAKGYLLLLSVPLFHPVHDFLAWVVGLLQRRFETSKTYAIDRTSSSPPVDPRPPRVWLISAWKCFKRQSLPPSVGWSSPKKWLVSVWDCIKYRWYVLQASFMQSIGRLFARSRQVLWAPINPRTDRVLGQKSRWTAHLAGAVGLGAVILFFFYAPRNPGPDELGLLDLTVSQALSDPGRAWSHLTALAGEAFVGSAKDFLGQWGSPQENAYLEYLGDYLQTMWAGAAVVSLLGLGGMLYDRYSGDGPTDLVSFASYWGLASVVGYPLATDIKAPWAAVHAVVTLAIPAAVAAGLIGRWTAEAARDADWPGAGAGALVLLIVVGSVVAPAVGASFVAPTDRDNEMFQYAQPQNELRPVVDRMEQVTARNDGTDVLVHGSHFVDGDTEALRTPACVKWFNALPLPWYLNRSGAQVRCTETRSDLRPALDDPPPVVVTRQQNNETVARRLPSDYEERTVELRLWGTETSFFFREQAE